MKDNKSNKKRYGKPLLKKFGSLVRKTLPGGSKGAEGGSGKAFSA